MALAQAQAISRRVMDRRILWLTTDPSWKRKSPLRLSQRAFVSSLGWLMGLEPTTTGITILDSTN